MEEPTSKEIIEAIEKQFREVVKPAWEKEVIQVAPRVYIVR